MIYPVLGLVSEAGEVADKPKKLLRDEQFELPFEDVAVSMTYEERYEVAQELGDVLWYVTALANDLNFSLEEVAEANLRKLEGCSKRGTIRVPAITARCVWSSISRLTAS